MRRTKPFLLLLVLAASVMGLDAEAEAEHTPTLGEEARFRGVVENVVWACAADAACFMTISGTSVLFGLGWSAGPWGKIFELSSPEQYIGKKVEVFCRMQEMAGLRQCSLQGKSSYYIRLADQ